jgi:hypothetical protein
MKNLSMKMTIAAACALAMAVVSGVTARTHDDDEIIISARMSGLNETPAPNTSRAVATFHGKISADGTTITYTLKWSDLTTLPVQSHIHFGATKISGGVMVFLCGGGKPACAQATSGEASGTITAADIVGPAGQGIPPAPNGSFADVLRAIRTHNAYANLHTAKYPGGEVRGQVFVHRDRDEDDDRD